MHKLKKFFSVPTSGLSSIYDFSLLSLLLPSHYVFILIVIVIFMTFALAIRKRAACASTLITYKT